MARLLLRLKARLLANTLQRGTQQALGVILAALFGLVLAGIGFAVLAAGFDAQAWGDRLVLAFAGVWVGWVLLPMLTFSSDETLDPRRFALLPVRPRALVPGLLAAGFVGVGPIATGLGATGAVVGAGRFASSFVAVPVAVVAVAGLLLICITTSRAVTTAASNLLASRRGRDLAALGAALLGILVFVGFQAFSRWMADGIGVDLDLTPVVAVARWLPGGMAAAAIVHAVGGEISMALAWLAGVGAWAAATLAAWAWAMERTAQRQPTTSTSKRPAGRTSLYPRLLRWLPRTRTTAVAMRFLRGLARDTRVRTQALQQLFILFPMIVVSVTGGALAQPTSPLLAALLAAPVGVIAANQLGLDGPPLWQHELAGAAPRADLYGRDLALTIVTLPLSAAAAVALAAVTGGWAYVPIAVAVTLAALGVLFGVANVGAVLLPIPVPEASTNVFGASQSGQGCVNGVLAIVVMLVMGVLSVPIVLTMVLLDGPAARAVGAVGLLVYGGLVLWGGTRIAAARLDGRGPELLAAVGPGEGS